MATQRRPVARPPSLLDATTRWIESGRVDPSPDRDVAPTPERSRLTVTIPAELHRRFRSWAEWTGADPSEAVAAHIERLVEGFRPDK